MHRTERVAFRPPMSPSFHHAIWRPPLPPPQVQVRLPWPPYFGPCTPRWSTPLHMVSPHPCEQEFFDSDSSSDSSLEDFQDPQLDSPDPGQSSLSGAFVPALGASIVVSQTTVEVHSFSDPSADSSPLSLCPSGSVGAPPPSAPLEDDTESDSPFASLTRRISLSYASFHTGLGGSQACRSSALASSTIRSFGIHSPSSDILQRGGSPAVGDPGSPRPSSSARRPPLSTPIARPRTFHRGFRRPRPSLPSRLETLTAYYKKRGCSRLALQIFKQGHSDGTHRAYESAWSLFRDFLSYKRIHPSRIRSSDIFNFLAFHRRVHNRQYRTLAKYRAAIKLPIKTHSKIDLDSDFSYLFMRGLRREVPPVRSAPMPMWSLDHLLAYLCSGRFEPLVRADFTSVVFKAIALLVIATGILSPVSLTYPEFLQQVLETSYSFFGLCLIDLRISTN